MPRSTLEMTNGLKAKISRAIFADKAVVPRNAESVPASYFSIIDANKWSEPPALLS